MSQNIRFQKGRKSNPLLSYPFTQPKIDSLQPCDLVNPFAMDNPRVLIQADEMNIKPIFPEEGIAFERELLDVASSVHLSTTRSRLGGNDTNEWHFIMSPLVEGELIPECFKRKYGTR